MRRFMCVCLQAEGSLELVMDIFIFVDILMMN